MLPFHPPLVQFHHRFFNATFNTTAQHRRRLNPMPQNSSHQHVAVRRIPRADANHVALLRDAGTATVHEAQGRSGLLQTYLRPIYPGARIAGSALTVMSQPGDNWMLHVAMELCQPGDCLVVACSAENTGGMFGDLLATSARS